MEGLIALIIVCLVLLIALFGLKPTLYWLTKLMFRGGNRQDN
jgi:hypothetical protein